MRYRLLMLYFALLLVVQSRAQSLYSINATVVDEHNKPLSGAVVLINNGQKSSVTNSKGAFAIEWVSNIAYTIEIHHLGYLPYKKTIQPQQELPRFIALSTSSELLNEIKILDNRAQQRRLQQSQPSEIVTDTYLQVNRSGSLMTSLERMPGVGALTIGSGQSKPMLRGLGFNRVVVVDDGVKHEGQQWGADHGLEVDQHKVESVEIIKGPASVMYGSDAMGGVLVLNSERIPAPKSVTSFTDATVQSHNMLWGISQAIHTRNQRVFMKARLTKNQYGDYKVPGDSVTIYSYQVPLHKNKLRNTAGSEQNYSLTLGYINNHLITKATLSRSRQKSGFFANAHGREPRNVDEILHDHSSRDILDPKQEAEHWKVVYQATYFNQRWQWNTEVGYQHNLRHEWSPYIAHGYMPPAGHTLPNTPQNLERMFNKTTLSANSKSTWLITEKYQLSAGIQLEQQHNKIGGWSFIIPNFEQKNGGLFVFNKWLMSEKWSMNAALRGDYGQINIQRYDDWFQTPKEASDNSTHWLYITRAPEITKSFKSLVWSTGVIYNNAPLLLKMNAGKSYRMPIAKELAANGVNYHHFSYEVGNINIDAEVAYQADLSLEINASQWSINFNPFYNYFPNYIFLNPSFKHDYSYGAGNQIYNYTQAGVVRFGGELQAKYKFYKWLELGIDAEYLYATQTTGDKKGFTLPFSPPATVIFNTKTIDKKGRYLSFDVKTAGAQNRIVPPEKKTPGYTIINAQVGTKIILGKQFANVNIQANNIFNTRYFNHTSYYRLINLPEIGRSFSFNLNLPISIVGNGQ